jgi:hypothetical protein
VKFASNVCPKCDAEIFSDCGTIAPFNPTQALPGKTPATVSAPAASSGFARLPALSYKRLLLTKCSASSEQAAAVLQHQRRQRHQRQRLLLLLLEHRPQRREVPQYRGLDPLRILAQVSDSRTYAHR